MVKYLLWKVHAVCIHVHFETMQINLYFYDAVGYLIFFFNGLARQNAPQMQQEIYFKIKILS